MRKYIRHPSNIPIECFGVGEDDVQPVDEASDSSYLNDIGHGGLSFRSRIELQPRTNIRVRIAHVQPSFEAKARVVWCRFEDGAYLVGVAFINDSDLYRVRMVEQVCHIEHYRTEILATEGRELSGEEAAQEWITKYAELFPRWDDS